MPRSPEPFPARASQSLRPERLEDLRLVGRVGADLGVDSYLVGGAVRDVLLGRATSDLDIAVVGPAGSLARAIASESGGRVVAQSPFGTWRIEDAGGRTLDLAETRTESYEAPAALPKVTSGTLEQDLGRRDYTINAMAVPLGELFGELIDPYGGEADLESRVLRTLHRESFVDDPTRILRGLELAARLEFEMTTDVAGQARRALEAGTLDRLSSARWSKAWARSFGRLEGPRLERACRLGADLGLFEHSLGGLGLDAAARARVERLSRRAKSESAAFLLVRALAWTDENVVSEAVRRWGLPEREAERWRTLPFRLHQLLERLSARALAASDLERALGEFDQDERDLLASSPDPRLTSALARYEREVVPVRLSISGADLIAAGSHEGPEIGLALRATLSARLDGLISSSEELEYACREVARLTP